MEARLGAKRALLNISKLLHPSNLPALERPGLAYPHLMNLHKEQADIISHSKPEKGRHPPPQEGSSTAEDTVKDGVKKTVEMTENVADSAKETLDGAWKAAKDTAKVVKDSVTESDDEYNRANEEYNKAVDEVKSIDELRAKAGGYDKAPSSN